MDSFGTIQRLGSPAACGRGGCNDGADIATTKGRTRVLVPLWSLVGPPRLGTLPPSAREGARGRFCAMCLHPTPGLRQAAAVVTRSSGSRSSVLSRIQQCPA